MKRNIERVCVFNSPCEINGFKVHTGTILGKIKNEDGIEFQFFMALPYYSYSTNCQLIIMRRKDIIESRISDIIATDPSELMHNDSNYATAYLKLSFEEWCSLLSAEQLEKVKREINSDISSARIEINKLEREIKNSLSRIEIVDNELSSR